MGRGRELYNGQDLSRKLTTVLLRMACDFSLSIAFTHRWLHFRIVAKESKRALPISPFPLIFRNIFPKLCIAISVVKNVIAIIMTVMLITMVALIALENKTKQTFFLELQGKGKSSEVF